MTATRQKIGQFFFSIMSHKLYDFGLYNFVTPYIWNCDSVALLKHYQRNISARHLEIGVGTGFLLNRTNIEGEDFQLSLMDLNKTCLEKSAKRLQHYQPTLYQQDITLPFSNCDQSFDSIAMNYVLHCVPGSFNSKDTIFDHVHNALKPGGVYFGATLLHDGVERTLWSRLLMAVLNRLCIFYNSQDSLADFIRALSERFEQVEVDTIGSAVIWKAVKQ